MFDLALSRYGDLIFAANRDFLGISGSPRVEQCIRTRIKIPRGSWVYDLDNRLGSRVHAALSHSIDRAATEIPIFVHEALDDMDEITVGDIQLTTDDERNMNLDIGYTIDTLPDGAGEPESVDVDQLIISLPL
jgi:hypothetical protein